MNIGELLNEGKNILKENNIEDYIIQAKQLLMYILNIDNLYLITNAQEDVEIEKEKYFFECIEKISKGYPIQYITNKQEFMKLNFYVDDNVLIPQPDTEILVEEVIKELSGKKNLKLLDMCTGSGAIAVSLAKYIDKSNHITAVDISENALKIAKKNAELNDVKNIDFIKSDMFKNLNDKYDIIVSNPPYIESETINNLSKQVQSEPHIALDGGKDGLDFYRILINESIDYLNNGGKLFFEIGYNQKEKIFKLLSQHKEYGQYSCIKDLGGNDRVVITKLL